MSLDTAKANELINSFKNNQIMDYVTVNARFLFFNGVNRFTVEYCFGLAKWFVFGDTMTSNCVYSKLDEKTSWSKINKHTASDVLSEYLKTVE